MSDRLSAELLAQLGEEGFLRLVEAYGGRRLFVPSGKRETKLVAELGPDVVGKLSASYAGSYLRVPVAKQFRARQYRRAGVSNGEIARRLGVTETTVDRIVRRLVADPRSGVERRQLDLFSR